MKTNSEIVEMLQSLIINDSKAIKVTHVDLPNHPKDCQSFGCTYIIDNIKTFYVFVRKDNIKLEGKSATFLNKPTEITYKGISIVDEFEGHSYIHNIFEVRSEIYNNISIIKDESGKIIISGDGIPYIIELTSA